jgi:hypothetical protein
MPYLQLWRGHLFRVWRRDECDDMDSSTIKRDVDHIISVTVTVLIEQSKLELHDCTT